jgi:PilZ domain
MKDFDKGDAVVRRKLGDRRVRSRYDIVGDLWGTLETALRLPLKNVGRGGALIHSHVPLAPESIYKLTFESDGQEVSAPVRVCHVKTQVSADGERTFLIGVEFVSAQPAVLEQVERWMVAGNGETAGA